MYIHFKVGTTVHYPFFWQSNSISISSIFDCISFTLCFRVRAHSWAWHPQIIHFRKEGRDNFWPFISITSRSKRRPTGWVSSISVVRSLIFLQDSQLQEEVHLLFFRGFPITGNDSSFTSHHAYHPQAFRFCICSMDSVRVRFPGQQLEKPISYWITWSKWEK